MAKLRIVWIKSAIGYDKVQRQNLRALGLRRLNQSVVRDDSLVVRGMINRVRHLVKVEEAV